MKVDQCSPKTGILYIEVSRGRCKGKPLHWIRHSSFLKLEVIDGIAELRERIIPREGKCQQIIMLSMSHRLQIANQLLISWSFSGFPDRPRQRAAAINAMSVQVVCADPPCTMIVKQLRCTFRHNSSS